MISKKIIAFVITMLSATSAFAQGAVTTDSRIKTLVFNENDVYKILTVYGYQANIEFSDREEISTISIGDRVGWQVVPSGHRLFIRAQEEGARTNMTVVTSKHAYQFDLVSSDDSELVPSEELSYVIRFYYPDDKSNLVVRDSASVALAANTPGIAEPLPLASPPVTTTVDTAPPFQQQAAASPPQDFHGNQTMAEQQNSVPAAPGAQTTTNYNYTYTGNPAYAPTRVYDDGKYTYVKLGSVNTNNIKFVADSTSSSGTLDYSQNIDGSFMVRSVEKSFSIQFADGQQIQVYNETKM